MKQFLFAAGALALATAAVAWAQDPKPAQPPAQPDRPTAKAVRPLETQPEPKAAPWGQATTRVTAARLATLEEEFEMIEAHREVRRAHVRAAEVGVKAAEINLDRIAKSGAAGVVTREEMDKAKLEVEAAKAQLDIRMAELREVEVKVKFAKKRLDDAKAAGVRPPPAVRPIDPKPVDPPPPGQ